MLMVKSIFDSVNADGVFYSRRQLSIRSGCSTDVDGKVN